VKNAGDELWLKQRTQLEFDDDVFVAGLDAGIRRGGLGTIRVTMKRWKSGGSA